MLTTPIPVIAFDNFVGLVESEASRLASRLRNEISPLAALTPDDALDALRRADTTSGVSQEELAVANIAVAVTELQTLLAAPDFDVAAFHRTLDRIQAVSFRLGSVLTLCAMDRLERQKELVKRPPLTLVPKPAPPAEPPPPPAAEPEPVPAVPEAAPVELSAATVSPSLWKSILGFDPTK